MPEEILDALPFEDESAFVCFFDGQLEKPLLDYFFGFSQTIAWRASLSESSMYQPVPDVYDLAVMVSPTFIF